MREIKVRGKAVMAIEKMDEMGINHERGWVTGNLITNNGNPFIVGDLVEVDSEYIVHEFWVSVEADSVAQYTGLKDKKSQEIYEGDIDIDVDNGNLSVVKYLEKYGAYCFVPMELYLHGDYEKEVNYEYGYDCYFHNMVPSKYAEIIGNIYENPELLEQT